MRLQVVRRQKIRLLLGRDVHSDDVGGVEAVRETHEHILDSEAFDTAPEVVLAVPIGESDFASVGEAGDAVLVSELCVR